VPISYLDVVLQELTSQRVKDGKVRLGIKSGLSDVVDRTVREKTEVCQPDLSNLTYLHSWPLCRNYMLCTRYYENVGCFLTLVSPKHR